MATPSASKLDRISPETLASNPRASLQSWKRYEAIVVSAFRFHPRTYVFTPSSHSPATVASRLRDAIRGCLAFSYDSPISASDLSRWYTEIIIKHTKDAVLIGPVAAVTSEILESREDARTFSFHTLTLDEIIAFTVLLSHGRISGPVTIFQPPDISQLPPQPNVEVMKRLDNSVVLF